MQNLQPGANMQYRNLRIGQQFRSKNGLCFIKYDALSAYCLQHGVKVVFDGATHVEPKKNFFKCPVSYDTIKLGGRFHYRNQHFMKTRDGGLRLSDAAMYEFEDNHYVCVSILGE